MTGDWPNLRRRRPLPAEQAERARVERRPVPAPPVFPVSGHVRVVGRGPIPDHDVTPDALWVPIIRPCWLSGVPVLVEGAAEPVPSADIRSRECRAGTTQR